MKSIFIFIVDILYETLYTTTTINYKIKINVNKVYIYNNNKPKYNNKSHIYYKHIYNQYQ